MRPMFRARNLMLAPAAFFALCLTAAPGTAQNISSPYQFIEEQHDFGFFVGFATENRGMANAAPGGGPLFGARFATRLGTGLFAFDGSIWLLPTERTVWDPSEPEAGLVNLGEASSLLSGLDGRIRFNLAGPRTWNGLSPFLTFGAGLTGDLTPRSNLEEVLLSEERFSFGPSAVGLLGGGSQFLYGERLTLRLDSVLHIWKAGIPRPFQAFSEELGAEVPEDEWLGVWGLTLAASFRF